MKVGTLKQLLSGLPDNDDVCCDYYTFPWAQEFIDGDEWHTGKTLTREQWATICNEYETCDFTPDYQWLQDAIIEKLAEATS